MNGAGLSGALSVDGWDRAKKFDAVHLYPSLASEVDHLNDRDCQHQGEAQGINEGVVEFRHVKRKCLAIFFPLEIHAPDAC